MRKNRTRGRLREEIFARRPTAVEVVVSARQSLWKIMVDTGHQVLDALLEEDRELLCGAAKGRHNSERQVYRHGFDDGSVVLGGRKVAVRKPRARFKDGSGEATLPTYEALHEEDPLQERVYEQMVLGVSTRKYGRSLESTDDFGKTRATSKSEVSRQFIVRTEEQLEKFLQRPLDELDLPVILIDGLHFADHILLVALGIDSQGYKHVLGIWEGTTESEETCRALLSELIGRGLRVERARLFVIDGAKGLRSAIRSVFGGWALVQRCRVHKRSNVLAHVPDSKKAWVRAAMKKAYKSDTVKEARRRLHELADSLEAEYPSAASSIREGMDETLTVIELGITGVLAQALRSTNALENLNGKVRDVTRRVKRWRGGQMIMRWAASALLEAEKGFRRVKGYRDMPALLRSLEALCTAVPTESRSSMKEIA